MVRRVGTQPCGPVSIPGGARHFQCVNDIGVSVQPVGNHGHDVFVLMLIIIMIIILFVMINHHHSDHAARAGLA